MRKLVLLTSVFLAAFFLAVNNASAANKTSADSCKTYGEKAVVFKKEHSALVRAFLTCNYDDSYENIKSFLLTVMIGYNTGPGMDPCACACEKTFYKKIPVKGKARFKYLAIETADRRNDPLNYGVNILEEEGKRMAVKLDVRYNGKKKFPFSFKCKLAPIDKDLPIDRNEYPISK